jgi:hypothetical protein|nr:MAG TPA: REP HELICASE [Caudoviricetes sp.]
MNLFDGLNDRQIEVVKSLDGRIRVVAGAGSGKTKVLCHRYARLVEGIGIHPSNILCITFTNKAAQEMKKRIGTLTSLYNVNDFICTFHGLCVKILRKEIYRIGYPSNFQIMDIEDSGVIAKNVFEEMKLDRTAVEVKQFLDSVSRYKFNSFDVPNGSYIDKILLPNTHVRPKDVTEEIRYIQYQQKSFSLDFNDLILFTLYILKNFKKAREFWSNQFNYIMVDETQDCNRHDWELVEILAEKHGNLFIVGDPDQAIYEWRGSLPKYFVNFKCDKDIILNQNYRSTPNILKVANSVISHNKMRIKKSLTTEIGKSEAPIYHHTWTEDGEGGYISEQIEKLTKDAKNYEDVAILYRASYQSRFIEQALMKRKIPYVIWGGIRFFERKEIKDVLAYLRMVEYKDDLSFQRIINYPSRKFGNVSMQKLKLIASEENLTLFDALKKYKKKEEFNKKSLVDFIEFIDECNSTKDTYTISNLLEHILDKTGVKNDLRTDPKSERLENVDELLNSIKYYEQVNENEDISLTTYLQDIALFTNADYNKDAKGVKLMTIHQAKGLEFPYVFICGLTEGIFPSHRTIRERRKAGEEEERRLMYVALTRAEKRLFLTDSGGYNFSTKREKTPSRFILEIKKNLIDVDGPIDEDAFSLTKTIVKELNTEIKPLWEGPVFRVGDNVVHAVFGKGNIIKKDDTTGAYIVKFKDGERSLLPRFIKPIEK